jgi:hypothetical protein
MISLTHADLRWHSNCKKTRHAHTIDAPSTSRLAPTCAPFAAARSDRRPIHAARRPEALWPAAPPGSTMERGSSSFLANVVRWCARGIWRSAHPVRIVHKAGRFSACWRDCRRVITGSRVASILADPQRWRECRAVLLRVSVSVRRRPRPVQRGWLAPLPARRTNTLGSYSEHAQ